MPSTTPAPSTAFAAKKTARMPPSVVLGMPASDSRASRSTAPFDSSRPEEDAKKKVKRKAHETPTSDRRRSEPLGDYEREPKRPRTDPLSPSVRVPQSVFDEDAADARLFATMVFPDDPYTRVRASFSRTMSLAGLKFLAFVNHVSHELEAEIEKQKLCADDYAKGELAAKIECNKYAEQLDKRNKELERALGDNKRLCVENEKLAKKLKTAKKDTSNSLNCLTRRNEQVDELKKQVGQKRELLKTAKALIVDLHENFIIAKAKFVELKGDPQDKMVFHIQREPNLDFVKQLLGLFPDRKVPRFEDELVSLTADVEANVGDEEYFDKLMESLGECLDVILPEAKPSVSDTWRHLERCQTSTVFVMAGTVTNAGSSQTKIIVATSVSLCIFVIFVFAAFIFWRCRAKQNGPTPVVFDTLQDAWENDLNNKISQAFNIIQGIARGLLYLHRDSRLRVIHRDLKVSNILLDEKMNPKISDFGLARMFQGSQYQDNTRRVVGTLGYMSPEYAWEGLFSEKSDIYSFGILMLEIISGQRISRFSYNNESKGLLAYAWESWCETGGSDLLDRDLTDSCNAFEVASDSLKMGVSLSILHPHEVPAHIPFFSEEILQREMGQTLSSPAGLYELGFFTPNNTRNQYVGMWFKNVVPRSSLTYDVPRGKKNILTSWKSNSDPSPGEFSLEITPQVPLQGLIRRGGSVPYWRTGPWATTRFSGLVQFEGTYVSPFSVIQDIATGKGSLTYSLVRNYNLSYVAVTPEGQIKIYWEDGTRWMHHFTAPANLCDLYGSCGSFGLCVRSSTPGCICLKGFVPKSDEEWRKGNWTSGAFAYISGIGCLVWNGELLDTVQFPRNGEILFIRLASSELAGSNRTKIIVGTSVSLSVFVILAIAAFMCWRCRAKQNGPTPVVFDTLQDAWANDFEQQDISGVTFFEMHTIRTATDNFSSSNKLGQGGFGPVYKGKLLDGKEIAVKRLSSSSGQGTREFMNEITLISKLQHRNLVRLLGCCIEREEKLLIYEFMVNKSLDIFLFDPTLKFEIDWPKRFNIIQGIARGLLYLHRDSRLRVIHRDLKVSNILLDEKMNPKISDFGLARMFQGTQYQDNTRRVVGTLGYMSPEYAWAGLFSEKSDIYSFGVLMLEIISGKRISRFSYDNESKGLLAYAWESWCETGGSDLLDRDLTDDSCNTFEVARCVQIGLLCVQHQTVDRPNTLELLSMITSTTDLPLPNQPIFAEQTVNVVPLSSHSKSRDIAIALNFGTSRLCTYGVR
ncbi:hypothetical protein AALP_AA2G031500 [Arabis alpina]|uniref:Protein kinase domain-containing protein n=1 Tax=Arabis alpina TaxID=50452 RepID=A0A087HF13_ARAAL|nr:hypothetical protein AALP_AA2G031500 [Arabis alpina]